MFCSQQFHNIRIVELSHVFSCSSPVRTLNFNRFPSWKGGFSRRNAPKNKKDLSIPEEEVDWSYKLSNEAIREITKTNEIKLFCDMQHLKYIAHVTRLENNSLQKQFLFCEASKGSSSRWKKLWELTMLDESQLRRVMINRKEFQQLLSNTLGQIDSGSNLMRTSVSNR